MREEGAGRFQPEVNKEGSAVPAAKHPASPESRLSPLSLDAYVYDPMTSYYVRWPSPPPSA